MDEVEEGSLVPSLYRRFKKLSWRFDGKWEEILCEPLYPLPHLKVLFSCLWVPTRTITINSRVDLSVTTTGAQAIPAKLGRYIANLLTRKPPKRKKTKDMLPPWKEIKKQKTLNVPAFFNYEQVEWLQKLIIPGSSIDFSTMSKSYLLHSEHWGLPSPDREPPWLVDDWPPLNSEWDRDTLVEDGVAHVPPEFLSKARCHRWRRWQIQKGSKHTVHKIHECNTPSITTT